MRRVKIDWVDSTSLSGWGQIDDKAEMKVCSIGWLLLNRKDRVVISAHRGFGTKTGLESYHSQMTIPKRAILKMRDV